MTINSIQNNFGASAFALKCFNSKDRVILDGGFTIDVTSPEYIAASQLEVVFDTQFEIAESLCSSAYLVSGTGSDCVGTVVKAQLSGGNRLIIEKYSSFDDRGSVRVILGSLFVSGESASVMSAVESSGVLTFAPEGAYGSIRQDSGFFNHFRDGWGCMIGLFSSFCYTKGTDMIFKVGNLPTDVDFEMPVFSRDFYGAPKVGSKCIVVRFSDSRMTFRGDEGSGVEYVGDYFCGYCFVREDADVMLN